MQHCRSSLINGDVSLDRANKKNRRLQKYGAGRAGWEGAGEDL